MADLYAQPKPKRSSTFGIIAIVISIIAFETPRFLLSMVFIALAAFVVIGLVRDGNKVFSIIAMLIGGFLFYLMVNQEIVRDEQSNATYSVRYEVHCAKCDVSYTNYTGGTDHARDVAGDWTQIAEIKGNEYVYLSASNDRGSYGARVSVYVNDKLIDTETSTGEYSSANVSCQPKDVYER